MMLVIRVVKHARVIVSTQRCRLLASKSYRCVLTQNSNADESNRELSNRETLYYLYASRELIIDSRGPAGQTTRYPKHIETTMCDLVFAALFTRVETFGSLTLVNTGWYLIGPDIKDTKDQSPA